ncbi:DUF2871 domain-containing protein [Candidatus Saccharibacteria bacterium]|nr:DUF2871 domain-containing protein [Candidatus Saccharibacteria bacterium]
MKKLYYAALAYGILGLAAGLFYRDYTKLNDFTGSTQLVVMHTHLFALGMLVMLIVLVLERLFTLSKTKWFNLFFWHYNAGLLLTVAMMLVIGLRDVAGEPSLPMINGIAGLGHIILSIAIVFLFIALGKQVLPMDKASAK